MSPACHARYNQGNLLHTRGPLIHDPEQGRHPHRSSHQGRPLPHQGALLRTTGALFGIKDTLISTGCNLLVKKDRPPIARVSVILHTRGTFLAGDLYTRGTGYPPGRPPPHQRRPTAHRRGQKSVPALSFCWWKTVSLRPEIEHSFSLFNFDAWA